MRQRSRDAMAACSQVFGGDPGMEPTTWCCSRVPTCSPAAPPEPYRSRRAEPSLRTPARPTRILLIGTVAQTTGQRTEARTAYETYLALAPYGAHASDVRAILRTL